MPSDILSADTGFPTFTGDMSTDQKIERVTNYLYMLLEQLRYTLSNLGVDNFNDTELVEIGKVISEPILVRLEDEVSGSLTSLQITVNGIASKVQDSEGNITALQQTATSLSASISSLQGDVTQVTATANGLVTRVSNAEGNVSTLTQTVNGFGTRVSNAEGKVSALTQTVNGFSSRISTAEGAISSIEQSIDGIDLVVSDGKVNAAKITAAINNAGSSVSISADKIKMTGTTTFLSSSENAEGELEINGNSLGITLDGSDDYGSSTIKSDNGVNFYYKKRNALLTMGKIYASVAGDTTSTSSRYALVIEADGFTNTEGDSAFTALKLWAAGRMSLEANGIYIGSGWGVINPEKNAFITLDAAYSTRIKAYATYSQLETIAGNGYESADPSNGYVFCTNGIYYNGNKILST